MVSVLSNSPHGIYSKHTSFYFFGLQLHLIRLLHTLSNLTPSIYVSLSHAQSSSIALSRSIGASGKHKPAAVYVYIRTACLCASPAGVLACVSSVASTAVVLWVSSATLDLTSHSCSNIILKGTQ